MLRTAYDMGDCISSCMILSMRLKGNNYYITSNVLYSILDQSIFLFLLCIYALKSLPWQLLIKH